MSKNLANDPEHWRNRAAEMRRAAEDMKDDVARQTMLRIAEDYERLGKRAEERQSGTRPIGTPKPAG